MTKATVSTNNELCAINDSASLSWDLRLAQKLLFKKLGQIKNGRLQLDYQGQRFEFGTRNEAYCDGYITVHDANTFKQVINGGTTGAGEAYIKGWWATDDLSSVIRLFVANRDTMLNLNGWQTIPAFFVRKLLHFKNRNTQSGSQRNIAAHYDLGNAFFELFLDSNLMYSSAVYKDKTQSLEEAAKHKLDLICQDLQLSPNDHVLEIGTGWGGFALHAAKHYGCRVTTTTISKEQYTKACERVEQAGLNGQIEVLMQDYRKLEGQFDKLASIEMIEAVGAENYKTFFKKCEALVKPEGLISIQAITIDDRHFAQYQKSVDFIRQYIFPGGCLPSIQVINDITAKHTQMQLHNMRDITEDYAITLRAWRERFFEQKESVLEQGFDQYFIRMWEFYLCYCEGGFLERNIGTQQFLFAQKNYRHL